LSVATFDGSLEQAKVPIVSGCKGKLQMQQPGLIGRHRDKNGEISRKHGNTLVSTLRKIYGSSFASGAGAGEKLSEVLVEIDEPSLSKLVHDHERGELAPKLASA
jgi:hypothetical protein